PRRIVPARGRRIPIRVVQKKMPHILCDVLFKRVHVGEGCMGRNRLSLQDSTPGCVSRRRRLVYRVIVAELEERSGVDGFRRCFGSAIGKCVRGWRGFGQSGRERGCGRWLSGNGNAEQGNERPDAYGNGKG